MVLKTASSKEIWDLYYSNQLGIIEVESEINRRLKEEIAAGKLVLDEESKKVLNL